MALEKETVARFLADLTALTHRYGIQIGGCGCCGSPFLNETKAGDRNLVYSVDEDNNQLTLGILAVAIADDL